MQRNCIFPGRYAPLTYYEDVLDSSTWMFEVGKVEEEIGQIFSNHSNKTKTPRNSG